MDDDHRLAELADYIQCAEYTELVDLGLTLPPEKRADWWAAIEAVASGERDELPAAHRDYFMQFMPADAERYEGRMVEIECRATELVLLDLMTPTERTAWMAGITTGLIEKYISRVYDVLVVRSLTRVAQDYGQLVDRLTAICEDSIYRHKKELAGIGERLHAMGGMEMMQRAYRDVAARVPVRLGYQHEVTPIKPYGRHTTAERSAMSQPLRKVSRRLRPRAMVFGPAGL